MEYWVGLNLKLDKQHYKPKLTEANVGMLKADERNSGSTPLAAEMWKFPFTFYIWCVEFFTHYHFSNNFFDLPCLKNLGYKYFKIEQIQMDYYL